MTRLRWLATLEDGRNVLVTTGYQRNPGQYFFSVQDRGSGKVVCNSAGLFTPITDPQVVLSVLDDLKVIRPPELLLHLTTTSQRHSDVRTFMPEELVAYGTSPKTPEVIRERLGQAGYEAFYVGDSGVPWEHLPLPLREAWNRAAVAMSGVLWSSVTQQLAIARRLSTETVLAASISDLDKVENISMRIDDACDAIELLLSGSYRQPPTSEGVTP